MAVKKSPEMLTIDETSKRSGISRYAIRKLILNDEIVYVKIGVKTLINYDRFTDYLNGGANNG